ncbi:MAG: hypothetical protein WA938_11215 [Candidatus Dormiibacterota bacterium]
MFRRDLLAAADLTVEAVPSTPADVVVSLPVGAVRALVPLNVRDDPWPHDVPDPTHPRYVAHALITGCESLHKNQRIEFQRKLAHLASLRFEWPLGFQAGLKPQ